VDEQIKTEGVRSQESIQEHRDAVEKRRIEAIGREGVRTDIHRRGVFIPEMYSFVGWYWIGEWKVDGQTSSMMRVAETLEKFRSSEDSIDFETLTYGDFGKCGICGARFMMGEVWQHKESLDMVHVGRECAAKYGLQGANWDSVGDERRRALEAKKTAARNSANKAKLFAQYPTLETAFAVNHYIIRDISARFERYGEISEKQIALVLKIARETEEQAARKAQQALEKHVDAPTGRQIVRGTVVSKKTYESAYGLQVKMTVKIATDAGSWLCWGSVPSAISEVRTGDSVEFTATLEKGRDAHFALFKRPTLASILEKKAA